MILFEVSRFERSLTVIKELPMVAECQSRPVSVRP